MRSMTSKKKITKKSTNISTKQYKDALTRASVFAFETAETCPYLEGSLTKECFCNPLEQEDFEQTAIDCWYNYFLNN